MAKTKQHKDYKYIDPKELKKEIIAWQQSGVMSERLGILFTMLAENISFSKNFINYTWRNDMIQNAVLHLCKYARSFKPEHPKANVFGYCTQIVWRSMVQYIKKENRYHRTKKELFEHGLELQKKLACLPHNIDPNDGVSII